MTKSKKIKTYAFVDAANLFYGGEKSLGWSVDYQKLIAYLRKKYNVKKVFYYAGVELNGFSYSILDNKQIDLTALLAFYKKKNIDQNQVQRAKFYRKLEQFGYVLCLKPVKIFKDQKGRKTKKANCDVDLTFDMMRYIDNYQEAILLSGDGDFAILIKYLRKVGKQVRVLSRSERTAKEIKELAGKDFRDFHYLRELLKFEKK